MSQEIHTYITDRGFPLLWMGKSDEPVVTLENYEKWYSVYVVFPDNTIEKVDAGLLGELSDGEFWFDHYFHPELLRRVAKYYKGFADNMAIEAATGRWCLEWRGESYFQSNDGDEA